LIFFYPLFAKFSSINLDAFVKSPTSALRCTLAPLKSRYVIRQSRFPGQVTHPLVWACSENRPYIFWCGLFVGADALIGPLFASFHKKRAHHLPKKWHLANILTKYFASAQKTVFVKALFNHYDLSTNKNYTTISGMECATVKDRYVQSPRVIALNSDHKPGE